MDNDAVWCANANAEVFSFHFKLSRQLNKSIDNQIKYSVSVSKSIHVTALGVSHLISLLCNDKVKSNFEDMKGALILALSNDI